MSKTDGNKDGLKVKPGDKKENKKDDLKNKAKALILKHPEVINSARDLFRNENGETIIDEKVPRGDKTIEDIIMPRNQGDLREEDLQAISKHAKTLIDDTIKAYDQRVAMEDALTKSIATLGDGKYAGKINASTYNLLLDNLDKSK